MSYRKKSDPCHRCGRPTHQLDNLGRPICDPCKAPAPLPDLPSDHQAPRARRDASRAGLGSSSHTRWYLWRHR